MDEIELKNIDIEATSVYAETGLMINKDKFLTEFLNEFFDNYDEFIKNGIEELTYVK